MTSTRREPSTAVTTVVMTRDRRPELLRTLERLRGPVVVVDNGSSDGTVGAVRELGRPDVTVLALDRNHGAVARTIGVQHARTPLVAFADDDSWWDDDALDRAAATFAQHPRLALLAARMVVREHGALDPVCEQMAAAPLGRSPDLPGPDVLGFMACAAVLRREPFLATGGFDDVVFFPGEEERVALDLASNGWGLAYVPDVVAHHHPSPQRSTPRARQALIERNAVLTAVMRRPWPVVRERLEARTTPWPDPWPDLARRSARALRRRRPVPSDVEARLAVLEGRFTGHAVGTRRS